MASHSSHVDDRAIAHARVLPLDIVESKGSGHAGTAVGLTPLLYVLFQEYLVHDPGDPRWPGRDRFVLSCGHTSLSLYVQLFLSGYGLELDDLRAARTLDSRTPGHPEFGHTPGVETTTGPLGQGIANAVGMAMERRRLRGLLDPDTPAGASPFDHRVWCLASDGDVQEGISHEASALAGHLRLEDLVLVWDDNMISIEGPTTAATSEDVAARYAAYGWTVLDIADAEDLNAVRSAFDLAVDRHDGPVFIRCHSRIGHPMPTAGGTASAHAGAVGPDEVAATKRILGLDPDAQFHFPDELLAHTRQVRDRGRERRKHWENAVAGWRAAQPERAALYDRLTKRQLPEGWRDALPVFGPDSAPMATRKASSAVLGALVGVLPELWGGAADLAETNGTLVPGADSMVPPGVEVPGWPGGPHGRMLHFGIREHAMGAILNGIALTGLTRPFGSTFFVFSDYLRPAVRLAALMELPVLHVWSHDSVGVGEDGPTHQPVEHLWANRAIPGLSVVRPADANETVGAWAAWLESAAGPTAICLSRQALPMLPVDPHVARAGTARGAYVVADGSARSGAADSGAGGKGPEGNGPEGKQRPDAVVIATGSEVHVALAAREVLAAEGVAVRVVSAPCLEWFAAQPADYADAVLPPDVWARVSVEAGIDQGWYRWIGPWGQTVSVEHFGWSGNGSAVLERAGITVEAVVAAVRRSIELEARP